MAIFFYSRPFVGLIDSVEYIEAYNGPKHTSEGSKPICSQRAFYLCTYFLSSTWSWARAFDDVISIFLKIALFYGKILFFVLMRYIMGQNTQVRALNPSTVKGLSMCVHIFCLYLYRFCMMTSFFIQIVHKWKFDYVIFPNMEISVAEYFYLHR